jgi:hypothetical protein
MFDQSSSVIHQRVRLSFQPLIFSQPAVFFSHNKPVMLGKVYQRRRKTSG